MHRPYRPAAFTLRPDLIIHAAYDGYWYWGRPTVEDLRRDLRAISRGSRGLPLLMDDLPHGAAPLAFDGHALHLGAGAGSLLHGRRALRGKVRPTPAHTPTSVHCPTAGPRSEFDQPEVQQVRRDALAWWIPMLGDALVCVTTLALDEARYGGAITVTRRPVQWSAERSREPSRERSYAPSCSARCSASRPGDQALQRCGLAGGIVLMDVYCGLFGAARSEPPPA